MVSKIVIIGGGFAGLQACRALSRSGASILLIDAQPGPVMLPALPDVAGGWVAERLAHGLFSRLLPRGVEFRQANVTSIDLEEGRVRTEKESFSYDYLLIACGSTTNFRGTSFPRARMYSLATLDDARRIRADFEAYLGRAEQPHLLLAGTGYTGLELAMSLHFRAQALGRRCPITIVDPTPILLPSLPAKQRQYVLDFLTAEGADVRMGVAVESFDGRRAVVGGHTFDDVFFCWATGSTFAVPEVKGDVSQSQDGRLKVAPDLSLPGYSNVFVAGDSAYIEVNGQPLRKAVNFAYYGGRHAGRNIVRRLRNQPARPFKPVDLGWVVPLHRTSIGRLPGGFWVRGKIGVRMHHLMCGVRNFSWKNFAGCLRLALTPNQGMTR